MRLIEILPDSEAKKFDCPGILTQADRKEIFKIDPSLDTLLGQTKKISNKLGLLLQYGYFKDNHKFFTQNKFRKDDIRFVAAKLSIDIPKDSSFEYSDRMRQKHRSLILQTLGYSNFNDATKTFESATDEMVSKQAHPAKILSSIVALLITKKIEVPSYDYIARMLTIKYNEFEKEIIKKIKTNISEPQQEALAQLLVTVEGDYQRPLVTRLKHINQSTRPAKIKYGIRNFLIIKKLFFEIKPLIDVLNLSNGAISYYAKWLIKAQSYQTISMVEEHKRYLHLLAFVDYYFRIWQDVLVDILQKSVQQQLNRIEKISAHMAQEDLPKKNKLTSSVLSGFQEAKASMGSVSNILYCKKLDNDNKILKLCKIVPKPEKQGDLFTQATEDASTLKQQIANEEYHKNQANILGTLSRKLQNRVSDIVKHLTFLEPSESDDLMVAIHHYQKTFVITSSAPKDFLEDVERELIYHEGKFNVSLYKALLFCKIANAIKTGRISLVHSYRYLSLESYLITIQDWEENKEKLLKAFGLDSMEDIKSILETLEPELDKQFSDVNRKIINKSNSYAKIHPDGHVSIYTPSIAKPDYDSVVEIIGKDRYIPLLEIMLEINSLTNFSTHFKHHKIKGSKEKPEDIMFYAGIFGIGSAIGIHKLANTSVGINYNTLSNSVNWYFSLDNLYMVNQEITKYMKKLSLPNKFKRDQACLHSSSDVQKRCVSAESLNADYSYKHHGKSKGVGICRFIDERGILFHSSVFSSGERDAAYLIDGLCNNNEVCTDIHSTDTLGYTEMIFAISYLINVSFEPRIKNVMSQNLVSFGKIRGQLKKKGYPITPSYYVKKDKIVDNWDTILRLIATIKRGDHKASIILKRLGSYPKQHPLQEAMKEFGRIPKSIFILRYTDDVELRQAIEKQLNKGELANKFASAVSFASDSMVESYKDDQEIFAMCQTIIQNIIILWNYVSLTKIIMRSDLRARKTLVKHITSASILTWQHVNMHGTYDFSNLTAANDNEFEPDEIMNFKVA